MARYGIGPVGIGGGRKASFTASAGPVRVTFGGGWKKRSGSTSAAERSHGQVVGPRDPTAAELRMMKKQWDDYCDYYRSLTPIERSIRDHWNLEMEECVFVEKLDDYITRVILLVYLCAQSLVAIGLFNFGKIGWLIFLLFVYLANQLYAFKVSRFFEHLSEKARNHSDWLIPVIGGVTLIGFMFLPILLVGWESPTVNWLAFGFFNYFVFAFYRGWTCWELDRDFRAKKVVYEIMTTHGTLYPSSLETVWYQVCAWHLGLKNAKSGRYFTVSFWFPRLYLKRLLKKNNPSILPFPYIAKPFVPYKTKMPARVPDTIYHQADCEFLDSYRERPRKRK